MWKKHGKTMLYTTLIFAGGIVLAHLVSKWRPKENEEEEEEKSETQVEHLDTEVQENEPESLTGTSDIILDKMSPNQAAELKEELK